MVAEVLEQLRAVDPLVDEAPVELAVRTFPLADPVKAARYVVVNTMGGWRHPAGKQLWDAMQRETDRLARETDRCAARARRATPPRRSGRAPAADEGTLALLRRVDDELLARGL